MFEKVQKIISEALDISDIDTIKLDSNIVSDLGADSLDLADIVMAFEEEFDTEIDEEFAASVKTVGDIVTYLENNL
ncbi:MAG: acyl carrier protein [Ruminococcus sp.]|jgi:acyl carrier protein|nr:acyl carrier protein [Ruminococcus sp.]